MTGPRPRRIPGPARPAIRPGPDRRPRPRPGVPRQRSPEELDAWVRPGRIYRIPVYEIDAKTGMINLYDAAGRRIGTCPALDLPHQGEPRIVFDYVGQSVRELVVRGAEHADDKPWSDLIAGELQLIDYGMWDKKQRDLAEIRAIHLLKPRFNYDHNLGNKNKIPLPRQVEQRHARDRLAGRPLWIPLEQRTAAALALAEQDTIRAGLDAREPRYPVLLAWDVLCAIGRFLRDDVPLRVQLAGLRLAVWAVLSLAGALLLTERAGMPGDYALAGAGIVAGVFVAITPTGRRKRQRKRPRKRSGR